MWTHDVVTALRSLRRRPGTALLNGIGLVAALTGCLLMGVFVQYETSVDATHERADRLVRLNKRVTPAEGETELHAITSGKMGPVLAAEMPSVERAVRVLPWFHPMRLTRGERTVEAEPVLFADSTFFTTFDFPLRRGRPETVLDAPRSMVVTASTAQRLFGDADPVGQTIEQDGFVYTVTGVAEDPPADTHLRFDAVVSWATTVPGTGALDYGWLNNWITQVTYTYLLLEPGANRAALEAQLPAFMERHLPQRAGEYHLYLQPFSDVYLGSSDLRFTRYLRLGNRTYVIAFSVVAVLLLLIACINFTNLAIAQALQRAREVGVRKAIGARPAQLARQFLAEATLLTAGATVLASGAAKALLPRFGALVDRPLVLDGSDPDVLAILAGLALGTSLLAGLYPALVLARTRPTRALRAAVQPPGPSWVRQGLVGLQLAAAVALIAGATLVHQQVRYTQTKDLGFDEEQVVTVSVRETAILQQYPAFKEEALRHPAVEHVTISETVPGYGAKSFEVHPDGRTDDVNHQAYTIATGDPHFLETYGIDLRAGRPFSAEREVDRRRGLIVNEALVQAVGWASPEAAVGRRLDVAGEVENGIVIGVTENFHLESFRQAIDPVVLRMNGGRSLVSARIARDDAEAALDHLRQTWAAVEGARPFAYQFLSARFAQYVETEQRLARLLTAFAGLILAVAGLGLFGLVAYAAQRRRKEIGIRKAVGATVGSIVGLLTREYALLTGAAFAVGAPLAYVAVHQWLQAFAYRIEPGVGVFLVAGAGTLLLTVATAGVQALRAARTDPARVLRSE